MADFFTHTITRVRAAQVTDRYGNLVTDWSAAERVAISGVVVQPVSQTETVTETTRQVVTTGYRVYTEPGSDVDVRATDRIEWSGEVWEVLGEVARWPNPVTGDVHHVEFDMQRVAG